MRTIVYYHTVPQGIGPKLIQFFMGLIGMKRLMEKKIISNGYNKEPAEIPKSIQKDCNIQIEEHNGRKVWTLSPANKETDTIILFLHGGAYFANITKLHWRFIEQLIIRTSTGIIVPDYPLAPESTCEDSFEFLNLVYATLLSKYSSKRIIFMGDSSGGGLALGFAMKIKDEVNKQPEQIILFSPWLDVTMSNPDIEKIDKHDKILSLNGLKIAGRIYAGDLDVNCYWVSRIYGDFSKLGRISIFIGTNEIFIADARKFKKLMEDQHIDINYFEYPKMFHDWIIVPYLKETRDVILKITENLKSIK